jgi:signal transduction histidine kinase
MTPSEPAPPRVGGGFTILKKGLLLAALPFVFQALFIGLLVWMRERSKEAEWWFLHTREVIAHTQLALADLVEAQNAARGFVVSEDPVFREDFRRAARRVPDTLRSLHDEVRDNSPQQRRAEELAARAADFLHWLGANELAARKPGRAGKEGGALCVEGRRRLAEVRALLGRFREVEEGLEVERAQRRDAAYHRSNLVLVAGTLLAVVWLLLLAWGFGTSISRRFAVLADNARRLGEGRELAPPMRGTDEIAHVDRVFHRMAEVLREAAERERAQKQALERRAEELSVANRELQEFASVASHDLQEPLRKIQAFGDRLRTNCAAGLGTQGEDYLSRMQNAAGRMQTLINDLLSFSRVTTKAKPFEPVDLAQTAREVVSDLEGRLQQTNGRVEIGEMPTVDADPTQMRQLLQNLIGNALKFHRPGESPVVRVEGRLLSEGEPACEIKVEDNGIGFEEKYLDRIFNVFQRLHGRNEYEGTGMGLAICRKIVERHGGRVTARSAPGQGSTFLATLPVKQPRPEPPAGDSDA